MTKTQVGFHREKGLIYLKTVILFSYSLAYNWILLYNIYKYLHQVKLSFRWSWTQTEG